MSRYGVIGVGGNRTHLEAYARAFAADPRCELVAIADEPDLPEYREGLNRLLASELAVPYLPLDEALQRDDVHIVCSCADIERRARVGERQCCRRDQRHRRRLERKAIRVLLGL